MAGNWGHSALACKAAVAMLLGITSSTEVALPPDVTSLRDQLPDVLRERSIHRADHPVWVVVDLGAPVQVLSKATLY